MKSNFVLDLMNGVLGNNRELNILRVAATPEWRCNLKCPMCYWALTGEKEYRQDTTEPSGRDIADIIGKQKPELVINAGRIQTPKAIEMNRRLWELGMLLSIVDNGYWIHKYSIEELKRFENISISIDGGPEEHDAWRGADGAYAVATNTILKLKEFGCDPSVSGVITSATRTSFPILEDFCIECDVRMAVGLPITVKAAENRGFQTSADDLESHLRQLIKGKAAKQIILFSHSHPEIERLGPVLREFTWSPNYDGTALKGEASGTDTVIEYRPMSITIVTEVNVRWDGKTHLSEIVDPAQQEMDLDAHEPYLGFWRQLTKVADMDRQLIEKIGLTINS